MRFGVFLGVVYPGDWSPSRVSEYVQRQAQMAYENNFEGLFAAHHYLIGPAAGMLEPITLLSHLAGKWPGIYVGTSIFLLPLHHPVEVAERTACLDVLSEGKFIFGVGQGYRDIEFNSFGIDKKTKNRRTVEGIKAIRKLWAEDNATFHGEFYNFEGISISIKPIQRPGPPIFMGADSVSWISKVPEIGDHWVVSPRHSKHFLKDAVPAYKTALERVGRPFKGLPMIRELCVAESTRAAEERIKQAFEEMYKLYQRWGQPGERYDLSFEELRQERIIVGSPREVIEQVIAYHQDFGADFMWFRVYWPGMEPQWSLETIQLFGAEVIPEVKRLTPQSQIP